MTAPALSVVVPVFNERDNVTPLIDEITTALRGRVAFEIVYVDDHSRDDSPVSYTHLDVYKRQDPRGASGLRSSPAASRCACACRTWPHASRWRRSCRACAARGIGCP